MKDCKFIHKIQNNYYNLLLSKRELVFSPNFSLDDMAQIVEEVDIFWKNNLDIINLEMEYFENKITFFLAGSMYLNIENYDYYYLKTIGEEHIIQEPFLKFRNIMVEDLDNNFNIISIFKNSYINTINLLTDFRDYFFILPLDDLMGLSEEEKRDLFDKSFFDLISYIFNDSIVDIESFLLQYDSIDKIDSIIVDKTINLFCYDSEDKELSLQERLDKYKKDTLGFNTNDYVELFFINFYQSFIQIFNIYVTSEIFQIKPFIIFDRTFLNFLEMFRFLCSDNERIDIYNSVIKCYILTKSINPTNFENLNFTKYLEMIKEKNINKLMIENSKYENGFIINIKELDNLVNTVIMEVIKLIKS